MKTIHFVSRCYSNIFGYVTFAANTVTQCRFFFERVWKRLKKWTQQATIRLISSVENNRGFYLTMNADGNALTLCYNPINTCHSWFDLLASVKNRIPWPSMEFIGEKMHRRAEIFLNDDGAWADFVRMTIIIIRFF